MNNIEELLRVLAEDDSDTQNTQSNSQTGGMFSDLDPEMLMKIMGIFESLNQPNDNEKLLLALKPLLREENQTKIDSALKLLKLFTILPILKSNGMLDNLGNLF